MNEHDKALLEAARIAYRGLQFSAGWLSKDPGFTEAQAVYFVTEGLIAMGNILGREDLTGVE